MNANLLPLTVGGLSLAVSGCYLNKMADNPNIILIMADDLGLNDLGVTGSDYHETPNLAAVDIEKTQEMEDLLVGWIEEVDAPIPSEPNPDYIPQ